MDISLYTVAVNLHLTTLPVLVLLIIYTDHLGWLWFQGKKEVLPAKRMKRLHVLVSLGLALMILSGAIMFKDVNDYLLQEPAFYSKIFFIVILIINGFFIGKLMKVATLKPYKELSKSERIPLIVSGVTSAVGWVGAISSAFMMGL